MWRTPSCSALASSNGASPASEATCSRRDTADLGHAHQDGDRGSQPHAVDAEDQLEPLGQVTVLADRRAPMP